MRAFAGPPFTDATPEAWLAYADFLQDEDGPEAEWLQALRFAEGLRRRPRLVLIGQLREEQARRPGLLGHIAAALDWLTGNFPPTRLSELQSVAPPALGPAHGAWIRPWEHAPGWRALAAWQWVTPRGLAQVAGEAVRRHRLAALGTTPCELPGLIEARPEVALAFFHKAAEGLRVEMREGAPWLVDRPRGRLRQERPFFAAVP
jgi:hypothetical protein